MWQIFSVHDATFLVLSIKNSIGQLSVEDSLQQFLFLGLIPGTNIQLSFDIIKYGLMLAAVITLTKILHSIAKRRINNIDPLKDFPPGFTKFDLIAL